MRNIEWPVEAIHVEKLDGAKEAPLVKLRSSRELPGVVSMQSMLRVFVGTRGLL